MEIGRVDMFEKYIDDLSDKKTLDKLLNDLGYDKGRENSTRRRIYPSIEGRNSQDQGDQLQGSLQDTDEENVGHCFGNGTSGGITSVGADSGLKPTGSVFKFREL